MATQAQIINRAANDLGLLRLGQALKAQDDERITSAYTEVYAKIKNQGAATWASDADIPDEAAPYVIALVAENCLGTYGVSEARYARIKNEALVAMPSLKEVVGNDYVSTDDPVDY